MVLVKMAEYDEIAEGQMIHVEAGGRDVLLAKVQGNIHAIDNRCGHLGAPLNEGTLVGNIVQCPEHTVHYDIITGKYVGQREFTSYDREVFRVTVEDSIVKVDVPDE